MTRNAGSPRDVFISHASEDKDAVVRPLVERLERLGVSVWYDESAIRLGDSLRRSIDRGLAESRLIVVVASPVYFQKEWSQRELDAVFAREQSGQSLILPVWHNLSKEQLAKLSPMLAARRAISTTVGLDAVAKEIQAAVLGAGPGPAASSAARAAPSIWDPERCVLLLRGQGDLAVMPADTVEVTGTGITADLVPHEPAVSSWLAEHVGQPEGLGHDAEALTIAFGNSAYTGKVIAVRQARVHGREHWRIELSAKTEGFGGADPMEMGIGSLSADDVAFMRAERILLDRHPAPQQDANPDRIFREVLLRGHRTPVQVEKSPFPELYMTQGDRPEQFLVMAKLLAVTTLRLSGVVAVIQRLDLSLTPGGELHVEFEGVRWKKYANRPPPRIRLSGNCKLVP